MAFPIGASQFIVILAASVTAAVLTVGVDATWRAFTRRRDHATWRAALVSDLAENASHIGHILTEAVEQKNSFPGGEICSPIRLEAWDLLAPRFMESCRSAQEALEFAGAFQLCRSLATPLPQRMY